MGRFRIEAESATDYQAAPTERQFKGIAPEPNSLARQRLEAFPPMTWGSDVCAASRRLAGSQTGNYIETVLSELTR